LGGRLFLYTYLNSILSQNLSIRFYHLVLAMLIFDAHLDLSLNALEYNRDLRQSVHQIRSQEVGLTDLKGRSAGTVAFPEMRRGGIGLCVATLLAGCMKPPGPVGAWESPHQAWAMTQGQLAWYRSMETDGHLRKIVDLAGLEQQIEQWQGSPSDTPIGYILSLEGADSLRTLDDLALAHSHGLRALGPAHYGIGRYALGHDCEGGLSEMGRSLLAAMDQLKMILDVTHLAEQTFWESLELYAGPVWASHHNCRSLVDNPRQLSDRQIQSLASRGSVIGVALDVWMVVPDWRRGISSHANRNDANFTALANHVDHIVQLLGTTDHVGIGTDLDGGYGTEQSPSDLDTIADLHVFFKILRSRGYDEAAIEGICHGNFVGFLRRHWS